MKDKTPYKIILILINKMRASLSKLYNTSTKKSPCLIYSNDGTGSGKTFGVWDEFINDCKHDSHHNLIYTTQHKSQFDFNPKLIKKAYDKGIEILSFLSRIDMLNLDFKPWVVDKNGNKQTNRERYYNWIKQGENSFIKKELQNLSLVIKVIDDITRRIDYTKINSENAFDNIEDLEEQLKKKNNYLQEILINLATIALNLNGKATNLKKLMGATTKTEQMYKDIICHLVPFAIATIKPCILLATTKKFDYNIALPIKNKKGKYKLKHLPFDYIIGSKQHLQESDIGSCINSTHNEQITFLKNNHFVDDNENPFKLNNISFTVVIDEEHAAHNIFASSTTVNMIDDKIKLEHVFAAVDRIYNEIQDDIDNNAIILYEEKQLFIATIEKILADKCEISAKNNLKSMVKIFVGNMESIRIKSGNMEQIINITRSVFSFTAKRYCNEQELKNIKIKPTKSSAHCELYYTTNDQDENISLHDILQLIMSLLYAASKIPSSSEFLKQLTHGNADCQNYALHTFIKAAQKVKTKVNYMFERAVDENIVIDYFFTYFLPKPVFSIKKVQDINYRDDKLQELTYVYFTLELITEQPEVALLRMLYNTQNRVILLSATTGFNKNINGQYNRKFLTKYCNNIDNEHNLAISIYQRNENDIESLAKLRESRNQLRNVEFREFSEKSNSICSLEKNDEFNQVFKDWKNRLKDFYRGKLNNQYHKREFYRNLDAMLLAAYDNKHTRSLSLSGFFMDTLKKYLANNNYPKHKELQILDNENFRVFEITPFSNKITIRVILFNSDLAAKIDVHEFTRVDRDNLKIVFMSAYQSAGTGLNYCVLYPDSEEDFERLVLINSSFWSDIIKDTASGDRTLYSTKNILNIMKYYANSKEIKKLKDFNVNLVNGTEYRFLMHEHKMELLKVRIQAIGRGERRDTLMTTEIYLPDTVVDDDMLLFAKLAKEPANKMIFASLSLLNHKYREYCTQRQKQYNFKTAKAKDDFEKHITQSGEVLNEFFNKIVPKLLEEARKGNRDAIKFNQILRNIESITKPQEYIKKLEQTKIIKNDSYYKSIIAKLYIDSPQWGTNLKLCRSNNNPKILTEVATGSDFYQPEKQVELNYNNKIEFTNNNIVGKLIKASQKITENAFKKYIPHPEFLLMLKGNMGEYIFTEFLQICKIQPLTIDDMIKNIGYRCYELFDFYIEVGNKLICIDVKNWSSTFDKHPMSSRTHEKAKTKVNTIKTLVANRYQKVIFLYTNIRLEYNPLNNKEEYNGSDIFYLNMFKDISGYIHKQETYFVNEEKKYRQSGSMLKSQIIINEKLIKLLQG